MTVQQQGARKHDWSHMDTAGEQVTLTHSLTQYNITQVPNAAHTAQSDGAWGVRTEWCLGEERPSPAGQYYTIITAVT